MCRHKRVPCAPTQGATEMHALCLLGQWLAALESLGAEMALVTSQAESQALGALCSNYS